MQIKICGLTSKEEAAYLNQLPVNFAGMVLFFPKSKRNISVEQAREILSVLDKKIKSVAVVVSPSMDQVHALEEAGFSYIQIHGEIPRDMLREEGIPILKAFNVRDLGTMEACEVEERIAGFVFDAQEPGSGKTFDWNMLAELKRTEKLMFLAGGLNPQNVEKAMESVHPDGVDVSSGVEYTDKPGKDPGKMRMFVNKVREWEKDHSRVVSE